MWVLYVCLHVPLATLCSLSEALVLYYIPSPEYEFSDYVLPVYVGIIILEKKIRKHIPEKSSKLSIMYKCTFSGKSLPNLNYSNGNDQLIILFPSAQG